MVCLGNICRSPMAQGIMEAKIKKYQLPWKVDSAGTSDWHEGEHPDDRAIAVAQKKGTPIDEQYARQINIKDFKRFDLICTMDASNYQDVMKLSKESKKIPKIELLLNLAFPNQNRQIPDPYFDGKFEEVYNIMDEALEIFIQNYKNNGDSMN